MVVAAELHSELVQRLVGGLLGHQIDQAARLALAVEHRCRPAQHLDALHAVDLQRRVVGQAGLQLRAVAESGVLRREAAQADREGVDHRLRSAVLYGDARCIGHALDQIDGTAVLQLLAGHDRQRLRGLDDRRAGLGTGIAAPGQIALDRTVGALGRADHIDRAQFADGTTIVAICCNGRPRGPQQERCPRRETASRGPRALRLESHRSPMNRDRMGNDNDSHYVMLAVRARRRSPTSAGRCGVAPP